MGMSATNIILKGLTQSTPAHAAARSKTVNASILRKTRMPKKKNKWTQDDTREAIKAAAVAMSDLNVFYAIIAILEGGTIHAKSHNAANRIIGICHSESSKRLAEYDLATAQANGD